MELGDRYRGCLLGLAAGDAVGTTLEFTEPGSFVPIEEMAGGGPFGLNPGEWTDDTSMAPTPGVSSPHRVSGKPALRACLFLRSSTTHGTLSSKPSTAKRTT